MSAIKIKNPPKGSRLGPYIVIGLEKHRPGHRCVHVRCTMCGTEKFVQIGNAMRSKSCGCLTRQILRDARKTHGQCKIFGNETKIYKCWRGMLARCLNKTHKSYSRYGGRGITICERWLTFTNFLADMGTPPAKNFSLGRINNDVGYTPENCRWETSKQQANNRRNSRFLEFEGVKLTISQWANKIGVPHCTLSRRLRSGWSSSKALTTPPRNQKNSVCNFKPPVARKGENYKLAI